MDYFIFFIGIGMGIFMGWYSLIQYQLYKSKQHLKKTEDLFKSLHKDLIFKQRIHNFVHFTSGDYGVVYIIDKNELAIFENEQCIAVSSLISKEVNDELIKSINEKFDKDINNIVDMNGYKVSKDYLNNIPTEKSFVEKVKIKNEKKFSLDEILDKITEKGIKSLTKKEIDFLKNI